MAVLDKAMKKAGHKLRFWGECLVAHSKCLGDTLKITQLDQFIMCIYLQPDVQ